ncbi:SDR family NAD(P)-dependent oxidoreductase [Streptomyces sp. SHP22-7]|nr:SDR family NAD(P)-dependent oxidoreductase [Streptomyces sp. SHP22-7]
MAGLRRPVRRSRPARRRVGPRHRLRTAPGAARCRVAHQLPRRGVGHRTVRSVRLERYAPARDGRLDAPCPRDRSRCRAASGCSRQHGRPRGHRGVAGRPDDRARAAQWPFRCRPSLPLRGELAAGPLRGRRPGHFQCGPWACFGPDVLGLGYPDLATASDGSAEPPAVAVLGCVTDSGTPMPDRVRSATGTVLAALQSWAADERFEASRLLVVTRGAVAAQPGEDPGADLPGTAVWGLVRSAQAENPGRHLLVDLDDDPRSLAALPAAVASGEPQLAIRGGRLLVPRLSRAGRNGPADDGRAPWDTDGTVLITGGTGGLGSLVARHLVGEHGVRRLLLVSRRGAEAEGAAELAAELSASGADARIEACDVGDRDALAELIAGIDPQHPLTGVVHTAGVAANAVTGALTPSTSIMSSAPRPTPPGTCTS